MPVTAGNEGVNKNQAVKTKIGSFVRLFSLKGTEKLHYRSKKKKIGPHTIIQRRKM